MGLQGKVSKRGGKKIEEEKNIEIKGSIIPYFSTGSGAFFGAGAGVANMLAQLFLTPSGIMLDAGLVATVAVEDVASVAEAPQLSFPDGLAVSQAGASSVAVVPHAFDSTVGTEGSVFSLREPLVCAVDAPRPRPPLPRSVPRPRPLPPSEPDRPPRATFP
jgi:hypothetical protein